MLSTPTQNAVHWKDEKKKRWQTQLPVITIHVHLVHLLFDVLTAMLREKIANGTEMHMNAMPRQADEKKIERDTESAEQKEKNK